MATSTTPDDDAPPPRRWGRAMLWLGAIALLVAAAIAASFLAEDDTDVLAEPPVDTARFCQLAGELGSVDELNLGGPEGLEQLRALELIVRRAGTLTPLAISADFEAVADGLRASSEVLASLPPDATDRIERVTGSLDAELAAVSEESADATAYVERWCGPLPTTSAPATSAPATSAEPVEPSVPVEPPG